MNKLRKLWQNPRRTVRFLVLAIIALFGIHGISLWAGSGQVIESENGKPLQGVYVMAMWHASAFNPVDSRTVCYNFAITQTDKDGQYSLPTFSWRGFWPLFSDRQRYKEFYLVGYENFSDDDFTGAVIKMRRSTETVEKRLQSFLHQRYTNCTSEGERRRKLVPLYQAQLDEANQLASTLIEKRLLESVRAMRLEAEIGFEAYGRILMKADKP